MPYASLRDFIERRERNLKGRQLVKVYPWSIARVQLTGKSEEIVCVQPVLQKVRINAFRFWQDDKLRRAKAGAFAYHGPSRERQTLTAERQTPNAEASQWTFTADRLPDEPDS